MCWRYWLIPVGFDGDRLQVAMADPSNVVALDDLRSTTGRELRTGVSTHGDIEAAINRHYHSEGGFGDISLAIDAEEVENEDLASMKQVSEDAPIVKHVNLLIPGHQRPRLRHPHRADRERPARALPHRRRAARGDALAQVDPVRRHQPVEDHVGDEHRRAAHPAGRPAERQRARRQIDLRWRPATVARRSSCADPRQPNRRALDLEQPRASTRQLRALASADFGKPYGMFLVVGPTGSGKSTRSTRRWNILNKPEVNIITVEDPVEYRLAGINQVQTHVKAGLTFAAALRSILRSDPDIVLIGEIRDHETAQIAVESALPATWC